MSTVEDLQLRIKELEEKLKAIEKNAPYREKIVNMSAEVVDSNPYRLVICTFYELK